MTKKERKIIADIRNKYGPILTYFKLKEEIGGGSYTPEQLRGLESLMDRELPKAIESSNKVVELLKSFG